MIRKDDSVNTRISLKVCVVGAGQVGSTFAYALMIRGLAAEIVLIDRDEKLAEGQAEDMSHGLPYVRPTNIHVGDYSDCENADIVVITAGAAQKPEESRLDLTQKNVDIYRRIIPEITRYNDSAILIVVSNPVDVLTYAAVKFSGYPKNRVMGSGTTLDSARFRYLISKHCQVDPRNVHAYIVGEHGDSEVPVWSLAHIAGMRLERYCQQCPHRCPGIPKDEIFEQVRTAAYHLIEKKGATYHAIGLATLTIIESIVRNQSSILTVSTLLEHYDGISDVCISVPSIVNRSGAVSQVTLPFNDEEHTKLKQSAGIIREAIEQVGLAE